MTLQLHNTLTKKLEEFVPRESNVVHLFVCGPTVYDLSHLGHAKTYVQMDILARVLKQHYDDVFYLQNITDIDDKIIARATEQGIDWQQLRSQFEVEYLKDMTSLNNTSVTQYARATEYIDDIISQVNRLIDGGHAYTIPGDGIYFEITTFAGYGKLSGRTEIKKTILKVALTRAITNAAGMIFVYGNSLNRASPFGMHRLALGVLAGTSKIPPLPNISLVRSTTYTVVRLI